MELIVVCFIIAIASVMGWKAKSITKDGAIAAFIVGLLIYLGFSYQGLFLLGCFFCSSSFFSKYQNKRKRIAADILEKGEQRDIIQVFANGGVPAFLGFIYSFGFISQQTALVCFCISLAAANADTWASEIGTMSKKEPRLLLTMKKVPRGTSGAVSILGTTAAIGGALFIAFISYLLFSLSLVWVVYIALFGFLGNLLDTIIGQTVQVKYKCTYCGKITEKQNHCNFKGVKISKYSFLNNDAVNFISIILATSLGFLLS